MGDSAPLPSPMARALPPRSVVTPVRFTSLRPFPRPVLLVHMLAFLLLGLVLSASLYCSLPPSRTVGGGTASRELFWESSKSAPSFWGGRTGVEEQGKHSLIFASPNRAHLGSAIESGRVGHGARPLPLLLPHLPRFLGFHVRRTLGCLLRHASSVSRSFDDPPTRSS